MKDIQIRYMKRALRLAKKGDGMVSPNPCVGAVVVKKGRVIAEGFHKKFGGPHAEVEALRCLSNSQTAGAELYVTLEPCSHHGKTPPCVDLVVRSGIRKVIVGVPDPNPKVNGDGIRKLIESGVETVVGVLAEDLRKFYRPFFKFISTGMPFVTLKVAQSMDGKNAVRKGSKYLLCEKALRHVHRLRYGSDAVMVGVNTVLSDDPMLNVRNLPVTKPLVKVVLDSQGRIPPEARMFQSDGPVLVYTGKGSRLRLQCPKAEVVIVRERRDGLDIREVLSDLGRRGIQNLLVEGGGELSFSILREQVADRLLLFCAPCILGGRDFPSFGGEGFGSIKEAFNLGEYSISKIGSDLVIKADLCTAS